MLSGDMARSQITDRVREADAFRTARATREARQAGARGAARRIVQTASALAIWPFKR